jgi:phosphatidylinositol-3,4,5-trisphosphate 3-phosphatase/dual-specificity protein phosphatase PTEN
LLLPALRVIVAPGVEGLYRNAIADVARFLDFRHGENYMVFNLSERPYDNSLFGNRVLESGFPDHFAPPVALCVRFAAPPAAARVRR